MRSAGALCALGRAGRAASGRLAGAGSRLLAPLPTHRVQIAGSWASPGSLHLSTAPARDCVVVVGGGVAGLYTAMALDSMVWPEGSKPRIHLIEKRDRFEFRPLLYDALCGALPDHAAAPRLSDLLAGTGVRLRRAEVVAVWPDVRVCERTRGGELPEGCVEDASTGGEVQLASGGRVRYDYLVLASGPGAGAPALVPGAASLAFPLRTLGDVRSLRAALSALERGSRRLASGTGSRLRPQVVVVGGSLAGAEAAAAAAELAPSASVTLLAGRRTLLAGAPAGARAAASRALSDLGVEVLPGLRVTGVSKADPRGPGDADPRVGGLVVEARPVTAAATAAGGTVDVAGSAPTPAVAGSPAPADAGADSARWTMEADLVIWCAGPVTDEVASRPACRDIAALNLSSLSDPLEDQLLGDVEGGGRAAPAGATAPRGRAGAAPFEHPFETDGRGAVVVDRLLRVPDHPRVLALGDAAAEPPGSADPWEAAAGRPRAAGEPSAQRAQQQARAAAAGLYAELAGGGGGARGDAPPGAASRPLGPRGEPFRYRHLGDMLSLGSRGAAVTFSPAVPPPLARYLESRSPVARALRLVGVSVDGGGWGDGREAHEATGAGEYGASEPSTPDPSSEPARLTLSGGLGSLVRRSAYALRQPTVAQRAAVVGGFAEVWGRAATRGARDVLQALGSAVSRPRHP